MKSVRSHSIWWKAKASAKVSDSSSEIKCTDAPSRSHSTIVVRCDSIGSHAASQKPKLLVRTANCSFSSPACLTSVIMSTHFRQQASSPPAQGLRHPVTSESAYDSRTSQHSRHQHTSSAFRLAPATAFAASPAPATAIGDFCFSPTLPTTFRSPTTVIPQLMVRSSFTGRRC